MNMLAVGSPRSHGLPGERVEVEGDPAEAVRALTARITEILQES